MSYRRLIAITTVIGLITILLSIGIFALFVMRIDSGNASMTQYLMGKSTVGITSIRFHAKDGSYDCSHEEKRFFSDQLKNGIHERSYFNGPILNDPGMHPVMYATVSFDNFTECDVQLTFQSQFKGCTVTFFESVYQTDPATYYIDYDELMPEELKHLINEKTGYPIQ